jgi:hypothetical protein
MKLTKQIIFIGMIVLGIYDFGVFVFGGEAQTVSQVMTDYLHISPFGSLVIGMVLGHFLWPMTIKKETMKNEPAFPTKQVTWHEAPHPLLDDSKVETYLPGLSKREYFAIHVLQALLSSHASQEALSRIGPVDKVAARTAVDTADMLIQELEKTK